MFQDLSLGDGVGTCGDRTQNPLRVGSFRSALHGDTPRQSDPYQNLFGLGNVQPVLWSLPVEVEMYLLLPLAFLIANRSLRFTLTLFLLSVPAGLTFHLTRELVPGLWRLDVVRYSPFFMFGVLCYSLFRSGYLMPEVGSSFLVRIAHTVCKYSYGIYLLHMPAFWIGFTVFGRAPAFIQWGIALGSAVALPYLAYHIEDPAIQLGKRLVIGGSVRESEAAVP